MTSSCIICGNTKNYKVVFREFNIDVLQCQDCRHVFSSYTTDQNYNGYFGCSELEDVQQFWWSEAHEKMYKDFAGKFIVGKEGKLLDVGCGLGYFVKYLSCSPGWQVFGCEVSSQAVDFAKGRLGLRNIFCSSVEDLDFEENSLDIITLWDVIEHIPDPHPLLYRAYGLLEEDGILFLHTPNIRIQLPKARIKKFIKGMKPGVHYLEAKDHLNIYSTKIIKRVLSQHGFNKVQFIHLRPIQSIAGSKNPIFRTIKNIWYYSAVFLSAVSDSLVNIDNLFVVARKR